MTCRMQVIHGFRLVILIASLLVAPINMSALHHPLMDEIASHDGCPHGMRPILDKSMPSDCTICIVGVINGNVSSPDLD
jgi:hypothetical protein